MKTLTINGVPYLVNEKGEVFLYSSVPPIHLGQYDKDTKVLTLHMTWKEKAEDWLVNHYRNSLKEQTKIALQKAEELQKAT